MSAKSPHIARRIAPLQGLGWDPHYLGFFACFNEGLYFEAHDVLEERWLADGRHAPNHRFYKGLIQLAGAFVHLQKDRLRPAVALLNLAEANFLLYPNAHEGCRLREFLDLIARWRRRIEDAGFSTNPLPIHPAPQLLPPRPIPPTAPPNPADHPPAAGQARPRPSPAPPPRPSPTFGCEPAPRHP